MVAAHYRQIFTGGGGSDVALERRESQGEAINGSIDKQSLYTILIHSMIVYIYIYICLLHIL